MAAKLSGGTAKEGVVAYQDHEDPSQFHYIPANIDCVLGDNLQEFSVKYWGVGAPYYIQEGDKYVSITGAVISGSVALDISEQQRQAIKGEITRVYGIPEPRLKPMVLTDVSVTPVLAEKTLGLGPNSDIDFPPSVNFGNAFNYLVGTGNKLFADFVAINTKGSDITPSPAFGINMSGWAEFVGDPWVVKVSADLAQVWQYAREKFSAGVSVGWFKIGGAEYKDLITDLVREQIIRLDFIEGSLDTEKFGRQIFEMGKEMFEALNQQITAGEGYFQFETNPTPEPSPAPNSWISWPWKPSINLGYGKDAINTKQGIKYTQEITYTGRVKLLVPSGMTLAVACGMGTEQHFQDLGDPDVPCITSEKVKLFNERIQKEEEKKDVFINNLNRLLEAGLITFEQYIEEYNKANGTSFVEDGLVAEHYDGGKAVVLGYAYNAAERLLDGSLL